MVEAAALLLIQIRRCDGYLRTHGETDVRGRFGPEVEQLDRTISRFIATLDKLGATPTSYGKLGFDVARASQFDLAKHWAEESDAEA